MKPKVFEFDSRDVAPYMGARFRFVIRPDYRLSWRYETVYFGDKIRARGTWNHSGVGEIQSACENRQFDRALSAITFGLDYLPGVEHWWNHLHRVAGITEAGRP
jgi:hypothetical protein